MVWVKNISIAILVLLVFVGGVFFDIFVIEKFNNKDEIKESKHIAITQNVSVSKKVLPQTFSTQLNISGTSKLKEKTSMESSEKNKLIETFNNIINIIKENKICDGGAFHINLTNFWENNTNKMGYDAGMNISCEFKQDAHATYNEILSKISKIIDSNEYLEMPIPPIHAIITNDEYEKYTQGLRYDLITKVNNLKNEYAKQLNSVCSIAKVDYTQNRGISNLAYNSPVMLAKSANSGSISKENAININGELPIVKESELRADANVALLCDK